MSSPLSPLDYQTPKLTGPTPTSAPLLIAMGILALLFSLGAWLVTIGFGYVAIFHSNSRDRPVDWMQTGIVGLIAAVTTFAGQRWLRRGVARLR